MPEFFHSSAGPQLVPIIGTASSEHFLVSDGPNGGPIERIMLDIGGENQASVRVAGNALAPTYRDGDVVIGQRLEQFDDGLGRDCIVATENGRGHLCILRPGLEPGRYSLRSYNPAIADIESVRPLWVAKVIWVGWPEHRSRDRRG